MEREVYIELRKSPESDYLSIEDKFFKEELREEYDYECSVLERMGLQDKIRDIEVFESKYLLVNVRYDGRKKAIRDEDIFNTMLNAGLVTKKGESMLGGFYLATEKLKEKYKIKNYR